MDTLNTVVNLSLLPALRLFHPLLAANVSSKRRDFDLSFKVLNI